VIGSIQHSWWHLADGGPVLRQVIHEASASGIDIHLLARREPPPAGAAKQLPEPGATFPPRRAPSFLYSERTVVPALVTDNL
jgi:hypothetical protein